MLVNQPSNMISIGKRIGELIDSKILILLNGEMGVGKSTLTRGIAKGLNVTEIITSPTFTTLNEYQSGRLPLFHFDFFNKSEDLVKTKWLFDDLIQTDNSVVIIEWSKYLDIKALTTLKSNFENILEIKIEFSDEESDTELFDNNIRKLTVNFNGDYAHKISIEMFNNVNQY